MTGSLVSVTFVGFDSVTNSDIRGFCLGGLGLNGIRGFCLGGLGLGVGPWFGEIYVPRSCSNAGRGVRDVSRASEARKGSVRSY